MTIKLATLAKAAEALDCELVYAIRPKSKQLFSEIVWNELLGLAQKLKPLEAYPDQLKAQPLSGGATTLLETTAVRRSKGWAQKRSRRP